MRMKSFMKRSDKILRKTRTLYLCALGLLIASVLLGLALGSADIGIVDVVKSVFGQGDNATASKIIKYVRLPRVLAALVCGAALSSAGAVIQGVLANKLASPSIIGVNSGAGLAVTLCAAFGIYGGWWLSLFAFFGAFASVMLVSLGARRWGASRGTVILMGVALGSLLGALSDTVITLDTDAGGISNDFKIGDLSFVTYSKLLPAAIITAAVLVVLFTLSNELDVLSLGDENARGLGLNASSVRVVFLILAALLASSAVSIAGLLSFVGLLVPHAVRRFTGNEAKRLLPLCALFGAGFVALCDTLARILFAPYELPVGIIMAFIGAPFFIFILIKGKGGHRDA